MINGNIIKLKTVPAFVVKHFAGVFISLVTDFRSLKKLLVILHILHDCVKTSVQNWKRHKKCLKCQQKWLNERSLIPKEGFWGLQMTVYRCHEDIKFTVKYFKAVQLVVVYEQNLSKTRNHSYCTSFPSQITVKKKKPLGDCTLVALVPLPFFCPSLDIFRPFFLPPTSFSLFSIWFLGA